MFSIQKFRGNGIIQEISICRKTSELCRSFTPKPRFFEKGGHKNCDFITDANGSPEIVAIGTEGWHFLLWLSLQIAGNGNKCRRFIADAYRTLDIVTNDNETRNLVAFAKMSLDMQTATKIQTRIHRDPKQQWKDKVSWWAL